MNFLSVKRSLVLVLIAFLLPFANVGFAQAKSESYDTKQLIRDVAILYRKHKLSEAAFKATPTSDVAVKDIKKKKVVVAKKSVKRKALKKKRKSTSLASAKKSTSSSSKFKRQMTVTATAYTSHVNQTDSTPNIAAWGDRLKPGMKVIAVSRDMLNKYGLKHRSKVRIKGLKGEYLVMDKMNKRWKKKIDIYMGKDLKKAFKWGRRKVELQWN
jgi:3D (Asp-Asp-Asp) domain-containing protein